MSALSDYLENDLVDCIFRAKSAAPWAASTSYSLGDRVYASTGDGKIYECTTAGTSAGTEPTWNTTLGNTTTDNTVTWTTYNIGLPKRPLYFALFTVAPSDSGGGTEVSGGAYARTGLEPSDTNWNGTHGTTTGNSTGTNGLTDNAVDLTFPAPTANWGTIVAWGLFDSLTGGNLLIHGSMNNSKTVNNNDHAPKFTAGDFNLTWA